MPGAEISRLRGADQLNVTLAANRVNRVPRGWTLWYSAD